MQYTIVTLEAKDEGRNEINEKDVKEFTHKVNELLNQGWEPTGGINITRQNRAAFKIYSQALIKK
jgi:hypothetical protein